MMKLYFRAYTHDHNLYYVNDILIASSEIPTLESIEGSFPQ